MKAVCLIENTPGKNGCKFEHGLSVYVETKKHKLICDTGQSDAFYYNALKLGIDLSKVDMAILSHGHYDHGGGIKKLLSVDPSVKLYARKSAFEPHFRVGEEETVFNGIDCSISEHSSCIFTQEKTVIDDEVTLFSGVDTKDFISRGNNSMYVLENGSCVRDDFRHEQYCVLSAENKKILISGCAHCGIVNIMRKYHTLFGGYPDAVISGFHLMMKNGYNEQDTENIKNTAEELKKTGSSFYSGHCTGKEPFEIMKEILGDKLTGLHSGEMIRL